MNLLISLPLGILTIIATFAVLNRLFSNSLYMLAGILALVVLMVYSMFAAINWPGADVYAIHVALYLLTVYGMSIILRQRQSKARLHWGPVAIFGFFTVVLLVDSVFILLAQSGMNSDWVSRILPEPRSKGEVRSVFPGVVSHDFRQKEEWFNDYQQQRRAQQELGWQIHLGWQEKAMADKPNRLLLEVRNKDKKILSEARITARFLYPADMKYDQTMQLKFDPKGFYSAPVILQKAGDWEMTLEIQHASGQYELRSKTTVFAQGAQ